MIKSCDRKPNFTRFFDANIAIVFSYLDLLVKKKKSPISQALGFTLCIHCSYIYIYIAGASGYCQLFYFFLRESKAFLESPEHALLYLKFSIKNYFLLKSARPTKIRPNMFMFMKSNLRRLFTLVRFSL